MRALRPCCAATSNTLWLPSSARQSRARVCWVVGWVDCLACYVLGRAGHGVLWGAACSSVACAGLGLCGIHRNHLLAIPPPQSPSNNAGIPSLTNRDQLEGCLGSVVLALAVVMAGSGHLPTFKLLRGAAGWQPSTVLCRRSAEGMMQHPTHFTSPHFTSPHPTRTHPPTHHEGLRKRLAPATLSNATQPSAAAPPTSSLNYGSHCTIRWAGRCGWGVGGAVLAVPEPRLGHVAGVISSLATALAPYHTIHPCCSMALGFLFMGGGTLTFGTSPDAGAAGVGCSGVEGWRVPA